MAGVYLPATGQLVTSISAYIASPLPLNLEKNVFANICVTILLKIVSKHWKTPIIKTKG
jgi:hypothetical protein